MASVKTWDGWDCERRREGRGGGGGMEWNGGAYVVAAAVVQLPSARRGPTPSAIELEFRSTCAGGWGGRCVARAEFADHHASALWLKKIDSFTTVRWFNLKHLVVGGDMESWVCRDRCTPVVWFVEEGFEFQPIPQAHGLTAPTRCFVCIRCGNLVQCFWKCSTSGPIRDSNVNRAKQLSHIFDVYGAYATNLCIKEWIKKFFFLQL